MNQLRLFLLCLIFAGSFQYANAQTTPANSPAVLNHIAVYVVDLKIATDFYAELFELKAIPEPFHDGRHSWFTLGGSSALHIISGAKAKVNPEKNNHLCFSVSSIDVFVKKLKARNISFANWAGEAGAITLRPDGVHQIYFQDPDGHWLEVNDAK